MKNVKWIKEIRVIDTEFQGFWQKQGWDNPAPIKTESTISFPSAESDVKNGEKITVRGFAYAGNRGIKKIEVSADGGKSWQEAKIKAGLSQNTWQFWQLDWTPQGAGKSIVMAVRATDGTGQTQTNDQADPYPSGANGWHSINLRII
jgi:DMSO/TMAO reductase YedYZ molybdopterin-dependent catalytic subunit